MCVCWRSLSAWGTVSDLGTLSLTDHSKCRQVLLGHADLLSLGCSGGSVLILGLSPLFKQPWASHSASQELFGQVLA